MTFDEVEIYDESHRQRYQLAWFVHFMDIISDDDETEILLKTLIDEKKTFPFPLKGLRNMMSMQMKSMEIYFKMNS